MAVRIEFTAPEPMVAAMDKARGERSRASFIKRALESALVSAGQTGTGDRTPPSPGPAPAPTRTSIARGEVWASAPLPGSAALEAGRCPHCGKANGVHKGDCPAHPGRKR